MGSLGYSGDSYPFGVCPFQAAQLMVCTSALEAALLPFAKAYRIDKSLHSQAPATNSNIET